MASIIQASHKNYRSLTNPVIDKKLEAKSTIRTTERLLFDKQNEVR